MIASLRGTVLGKDSDRIIVEAGGVGYEVHVPAGTAGTLSPGQPCFLHIEPSYALYGGGQTLYGFLTPAEKSLFLAFKNEVPSTGAKKALEYLDKASKSLSDFRRAILEKDARILCGVFGFTRKTADRLVEALKDKLDGVPVPGPEKIARAAGEAGAGALAQALSALSALGYKGAEARSALSAVAEEASGQKLAAEQILRLALKRL